MGAVLYRKEKKKRNRKNRPHNIELILSLLLFHVRNSNYHEECMWHMRVEMIYEAAAYLDAGVATKTLTSGGVSGDPFNNDDQLGRWLGMLWGSWLQGALT